MTDENENLNSLKEEKSTLEEEMKTLDSEADNDRIIEIKERLLPLKDEILIIVEEKNKQLFNRAKKAEDGFKEAKAKIVPDPVDPKEKPVTTSTVTLDEVVLLKEYDIDDLTMLKTIQAGTKSLGTEMSLPQAKESVLFQAYIKEKKAKAKQEKAQLPASKTSLNVNKDGKPLSREEHRKLFEETLK